MPAIIQATNVAEFLADGNVQGVPAVQGSDINDGDLLNATRTIELGNGYRFEITLPSGRVLESAPVGSDYPKRDAIMQWLGAVRESIVEDSAHAARSARDAHLAEPIAESVVSHSRGPSPRPDLSPVIHPTDPVEYARLQLRAALERLAALADAESEVNKWRRVVDSLTGESTLPKKRKKKRKVVKKRSPADTGGK